MIPRGTQSSSRVRQPNDPERHAQGWFFDLDWPPKLPPGWIGPHAPQPPQESPRLAAFVREIGVREEAMSNAAKAGYKFRFNRLLQSGAVERFNCPEIMAHILALRGFSGGRRLEKFLHPKLKRDLPDIRELEGLDKACSLIIEAAIQDRKIGLYGDYDTDGILASVLMHHALKHLGCRTEAFFPDRIEDGYGLNRSLVRQAADRGCRLLLALDFGTTNSDAIHFARQLGLKVIVCDHHLIQRDITCPADAFINPNQPGCGYASGTLCAGGLAWILARGLREEIIRRAKEKASREQNPRLSALANKARSLSVYELSAYAYTTIIADVAELEAANRAICRIGRRALSRSGNLGLIKLMEKSGVAGEISADDISFGLAPRINAAGRMVKHEEHGLTGGELAFSLFTTGDQQRANEIANLLAQYNRERQDIEGAMLDLAGDHLARCTELPAAIVIADERFHEGVVGIVASRLVDRFGITSILLGKGKDGLWKGSARAAPGENISQMLAVCSGLLHKFGGHKVAAGLAVEDKNLAEFAGRFTALAQRIRAAKKPEPLLADCELSLARCRSLGLRLIRDLEALEPCGQGNPAPLFLARAVRVAGAKVHNGRHLGVILQEGNSTFMNGMKWHDPFCPALQAGQRADIIYRPMVDKYAIFHGYAGGVQLQIVEAVPC